MLVDNISPIRATAAAQVRHFFEDEDEGREDRRDKPGRIQTRKNKETKEKVSPVTKHDSMEGMVEIMG